MRSWEQVTLGDPQRTFAAALPEMLASVTAGQVAAAAGAAGYVGGLVVDEGVAPDPVAVVDPRRFAGITSDGRTLPGLLTQPLIRALYLRTQGADDRPALLGGRLSLETLVRTEILDTGRDAVATAGALDREVKGYVRQVHLPSCGRCTVLAGKFFRRNAGFARHPRCDCSHVPTTRTVKAGEVDQSPRSLFDSMTRDQQDRGFGKANAEVIRRGGDIGQVVNARRGMATAGSSWSNEGATVRGAYGRASVARGQVATKQGRRNREVAPRPSPGFLLEQAGDDPELFALALERAGYL